MPQQRTDTGILQPARSGNAGRAASYDGNFGFAVGQMGSLTTDRNRWAVL